MLMKIIRNDLTMKGQLVKRCVLISARFCVSCRGELEGYFSSFDIWLHARWSQIVVGWGSGPLLLCSNVGCYKFGYIHIVMIEIFLFYSSSCWFVLLICTLRMSHWLVRDETWVIVTCSNFHSFLAQSGVYCL